MDSSSREPAGFITQANALVRKNLILQKRTRRRTVRLVLLPVYFFVLIAVLQKVVNKAIDKPCGCRCVDVNGNGSCQNTCGIQYSTQAEAQSCGIPSPQEWPSLLQVPRPEYRAASMDLTAFAGLPNEACREEQSCPATLLLTGENRSIADGLGLNLFTSFSPSNLSESDYLSALSESAVAGTDTPTPQTEFLEPAFFSDRPIFLLQNQCRNTSTPAIPVAISTLTLQQETKCVQGLPLWRNSSSEINRELFVGYRQGNLKRAINEIMTAYDFSNTNEKNFNATVWYNSTYKNDTISGVSPAMIRVTRSVNMISNSYLQLVAGSGVRTFLDFIKEMPKPVTKISIDFSSLLGPLFFQWVVQILLPIMSTQLVYEKQHRLRIMMKMHGLGDAPYWIISYAYFLFLSLVYVFLFVIVGSLIGLDFFTKNDYGIQFLFYFTSINLQIVLAFLAPTFFSHVKTTQSIVYLYIFGSGLMAGYLLPSFIQDVSFPHGWIVVMEILPAFCLYRGLYEFGQYAFQGVQMGTPGMRWSDLNDGVNGMREVLIITTVEWILLLPVAYYLNKAASPGSSIRTSHLTFLKCLKKFSPFSQTANIFKERSEEVSVNMENPDVFKEIEAVEQLLEERSTNSVICHKLVKKYPGRDGNQDKVAVRGLSLAVHNGECFGVLGPNGAGKTSFINMMIGLTEPTSGNAFIRGFNIQTDMDRIYTAMGVCPQNDMLWGMLTGREHLFFYGRLKNLKNSALALAVEDSLRSVNLLHGGVADKQVKKYSGGMKRRLSFAISLIGDPKVVYLDEPSTGLDPASRKNLWNALGHAKQNRSTILTTHSMEEAEVLCDRVGIFVDGSLQCIGNPKELKARYGDWYMFTMTASPDHEQGVENLVRSLSPNAKKIYNTAGTLKFELPKREVRAGDVFMAVEQFKSRVGVQAWGLTDVTLEDVFVKVAKGAQIFDEESP